MLLFLHYFTYLSKDLLYPMRVGSSPTIVISSVLPVFYIVVIIYSATYLLINLSKYKLYILSIQNYALVTAADININSFL